MFLVLKLKSKFETRFLPLLCLGQGHLLNLVAGSGMLHLDLDLLGQTFIVLAQNDQNFVAAKVIRHFQTFGEHLAQLGARQDDPIFLGMRTSAHGGHAVALLAVEGPVDLQRLAEQILTRLAGFRNAIEDFLRLEQAVEVADAGMVTTDNHLVDAVVLTEGGVEQGLARTGIAHVQRIAGAVHVFLDKIVIDQGFNGLDAHFGRDVAFFQVADQGVNQHAVADLHRNLGQELVGTVHRVAENMD